jgi:hypothetical protein
MKVNKKYETGLGIGGSGNWIKDAGKKVVWLKERRICWICGGSWV